MNSISPLFKVVSISCCVTIHTRRSSTPDQLHRKIQRNYTWEFPYSTGKSVLFERSEQRKITKYPAGLCHWHLPVPERNDLSSSQQTQRGHAVWQGPQTVARKRPVMYPKSHCQIHEVRLIIVIYRVHVATLLPLVVVVVLLLLLLLLLFLPWHYSPMRTFPSLMDFSQSALIPDFSFQLFVLFLLISVYT